MTTTITAAVVRALKAPMTIEQLELDEIRPNEVRVRMVATGVCHTDAIVRDGVYPAQLPAVLGHEGAGIVEQVGAAVKTINLGDHVVMSAAYCTHCLQCRSGHVAYCENLFAEDFGGRRTSDGTTSLSTHQGEQVSSHFFGQSSFATYANVLESAVIAVPKDVPLEAIAFLGCGMQTGAGAILNELRPPAGSSVAVSGSGAVGLAAIMAAKIAGATTIVAIDVHDSRLALAKELGATHTINAKSVDTGKELMRITGDNGVNFILDTTAVPQVLANLAKALSIRGTLALVGAARPGTEAPFEIGASLVRGWTFKTIVQGSSVPQEFIPRLIELWRQGRFPVEKLSKTYQFEEINQAFADSAAGLTIKPVILFP
ncbi:NAD(P)-dependent alcohol dehydrogenase [Rhodoferax sp.]|uniref:NAD(P)-dependent alcohol dehydrogenase n=1 Tax=Rhodoferax sp. TaxID=50421 RepID=UPI0025D4578F|nr:NAD(P)-dependent alcohol dehydrogenase [Rhodoferax sp.]MCM2339731.1 NAD(P)-dependent alcohol dehydrogenase [Rhodoferax sp.]